MAKSKVCPICSKEFKPSYSSLQRTCSVQCAREWNSSKEVQKRVKQMKQDLKTHKDYVQILQKVFNTFIRLRDKDKPCISCSKPLTGVYHSGHFHSVGRCNTHLSGNLAHYANNLPKRIGWERFEELFAPHEPEKLSIEEIKEKINYYKTKIKQHENN